MKCLARFDFSEISPSRVVNAITARLSDIPHALTWQFDPLAKKNKELIQQFKDIHKGKRCFIIANGPSLQKTDLNLLKNEITFGLNRIYLLFDQMIFIPNYFVSVNELVLDQFAPEISKLPMIKFLNWSRHSQYGGPSEDIIYLKRRNAINDTFLFDLRNPMVFGATITYVTLQIAFYMGFQKVIIIGLDHNFAEKGAPNSIEKRSYDIDKSHFHPQYFPKGIKWQLPDIRRSDIDYTIAREVYEKNGREIIDATISGQCKVFQKADYLSLF